MSLLDNLFSDINNLISPKVLSGVTIDSPSDIATQGFVRVPKSSESPSAPSNGFNRTINVPLAILNNPATGFVDGISTQILVADPKREELLIQNCTDYDIYLNYHPFTTEMAGMCPKFIAIRAQTENRFRYWTGSVHIAAPRSTRSTFVSQSNFNYSFSSDDNLVMLETISG